MDIAAYSVWALRLANTWDPLDDEPEQLPDVAAFRELVGDGTSWGDRVGPPDIDALHDLRSELRAALTAEDDAEAVGRLNRLLSEVTVQPVISGHDHEDWHLHLDAGTTTVAESYKAVAVMGLVALLLDLGFDRRGACAASDCEDVFVDTSRNRSRRYCSETCATRANVAAYRARRRAGRRS